MFVHRSAAAGAGKPSRQVGIACDLTVRVLQPRARAKRFFKCLRARWVIPTLRTGTTGVHHLKCPM
jgi:hypothetical protein